MADDDNSETQAADGGRCYPTANSLADFMRMLEEGQFDADVTHDLRELAADMENMSLAYGGAKKLAAELAIKVKIERTVDGYYLLRPTHSIKKPKEDRKSSLAWLTEDNAFTPNQPRQGIMFGTVRDDVTPLRRIKN